jgi:hypothetical protein
MANQKLVTPPFRVCFPNVFEKRSFNEGEPKFSVMAVFDPSSFGKAETAAFKRLQAAANEAAKDKLRKPLSDGAVRSPFRDGAEKEHLEGIEAGFIFITLSTKLRPGVIDRDMQPIIDEEVFYPGCYARATVNAYAYDNVSKGVAFGLQNIQKIGDGENLTGRTKAEDDFEGDAPEWGDTSATGDDDLLA